MLPFKLLSHPRFTVDLGPHIFRSLGSESLARSLNRGALRTPQTPRSLGSESLAHSSSRGTPCVSPGPAQKYRLVRERLLEAGIADHSDVVMPRAAADEDVLRVHTADYVRRIKHQGNGTAAIFGRDPDAFTVSLHQEHNYPPVKPPSTIDAGLADGTGDDAYLAALEAPLARALDFRPDRLWYLAGADPYQHDLLGGLALTRDGLRERDRRVFAAARAAGVPVAATLAGGYAASPADTVTIHVGTVVAAAEVFA